MLQKSVNCIPWSARHYIRHVPLIAATQRWLVHRFLSDREFVHRINAGPAKGLIYPVSLPQDKQIWTGTWESKFSTQVCSHVSPGDVCYDIGGHRGFLSGVMVMAGAGEVHCFEPNPENAQQIRQVIGLNPKSEIHLHEMALCDIDGDAEFLVMPSSSMGKLAQSTFQESATNESLIAVKTHQLDTLVSTGAIPPPNLIKIDVEGAELTVLKGAKATLNKHRPTVFLEFHSRQLGTACRALLQNHGYQIKAVAERDEMDEVGHFVATK
jgi:FkbM family methyltransferase